MEIETTDQLILFTNFGKYILIRVHELPDIRWRESGVHISNLTTLDDGEKIVRAIPIREFTDDRFIVFFTKYGLVKKTGLNEYKTTRKQHRLIALNLRKEDEVVNVVKTDGNHQLVLTTNEGYGIRFHEEEIWVDGMRARRVSGMQVRDDDHIVWRFSWVDEEKSHLFLVAERGAGRRMAYNSIEQTHRPRR